MPADTDMDFTSLSALTTPEFHNTPSTHYQTPTFSEPPPTHSQHTASSPSTSSTPPSIANVKRGPAATRKRGREDTLNEDDEAAIKRHRNTLAARKYRQKRLDRIKELEDALEDMTRERDDLRIRLARQEAETEALKTMMKIGSER